MAAMKKITNRIIMVDTTAASVFDEFTVEELLPTRKEVCIIAQISECSLEHSF